MKKSTKDIQMKKNLGRILFTLILFFISAHAQNLAEYKLLANKKSAYVKEAIVITFTATQLNHTDNMMFSLHPKKSNDFKIILLNKKIDDKEHHSSHTVFTYLLFPLKAKEIAVNFDLTIRTASDNAVAQSYVDDHDGSVGIQTNDTKIAIEPLQIKVKKLAKNVALVGDFKLKKKLQNSKINQYESTNIVYTLSGTGYDNKNIRPIKKIKNVTIFSEINDIYSKLTQDGYKIKREYIYALSTKDNFTIPKTTLQAYSPKRGIYYTLTIPKQIITVTKINTSSLLDKEESPKNEPSIDFEKFKQFLIYLMIFVSGYITALNTPKKIKKKLIFQKHDALQKAKTAKELLAILTNSYDLQEMHDEIRVLEELVYKENKSISFKKIKAEIIEKLKNKRIY